MKRLILILMLAMPSAWACKCNPAVTKALMDDPTSAEFPFIGSVELSEGQRIIRTEARWSDKVKVYYQLEDMSSCRLSLPSGQRYLVLTSSSERLHRCHSVFVPIKDAAPILEKLQDREAPDWALKPKFVFCQANEDCELSYDPCRNRSAAARKYLQDYEKWAKASQWPCGSPPPPMKYRPICWQNLCSAEAY